MRKDVFLKIVDLADGTWEFDIKAGMNDAEIWVLLSRLRYVEDKLRDMLETDLIKATETIEFLKQKKLT